MLIDIPAVIAFDCQECSRTLRNVRTFTLRIDIDDDNVPVQYQRQYPPRADTDWETDRDGILCDLLPSKSYCKILAAARAHPEDYEALP